MQDPALDIERIRAPLTHWLVARLRLGGPLRIESWDRLAAGHSNETYEVKVSWDANGKAIPASWIVRTPPEGIGLLAPYDVGRQFRVMQTLAGSEVPVPRMLWLEEDTKIIGRPFFLMEKLAGACIEKELTPEVATGGAAVVTRLCERYAELLAAVHQVDWRARGLGLLGDGSSHLKREIGHWENEIRRVQNGPVPGLDSLIAWLREQEPAQSERVALVHGDAKLGNLFVQGTEVVGLLDWELAAVGDPMLDIGWAAVQWGTPSALLSTCPGAPDKAALLAHYERCGGVRVHDLPYYEALAGLKLNAILFVASMMYRNGQSADPRFRRFGDEVLPFTLRRLLTSLGFEATHPLGDIGATA